MDEKSLDLIELKKKILLPHLGFVEAMLEKVKGTTFEEKWKIMHECITSDKKRPSYEKIKKLEKAIVDLKNQSKQRNDTVTSMAKQNTIHSQQPSTSKIDSANNVNIKTNETDEINIDRDPRRRVSTGPKTIYKPISNNEFNQSPVISELQKKTTHPSPSFNHERFARDNTGSQKYQNINKFPNRSSDKSVRGRTEGGHFNFSKERIQGRFERDQNVRSHDDSYFKRKRSESPVVREHNMPKRRFSCYESGNNTERRKIEGDIRFDSKVIDRPHISRNSNSNLSKDEIISNESKNVSQTENNPQDSISTSVNSNIQVENEPIKSSKRRIEEQSIECTNLSEAVKKIQSFKIPKVIYSNKKIQKHENLGPVLLQKEADLKTKDDSKNLENKSDHSDEKPTENDNAQKKLLHGNKLETKVILKGSSDVKLSDSNFKSPNDMNESKIDASDCDSKILPENSPIYGNDNTTANSEESTIRFDIIQKTENTKVILPEEYNSNAIVESKEINSSCIEETNLIADFSKESEKATRCDSQDEANISFNEKETKRTEKANILSNLLENEDENSEKILEDIIGALGAEKVKKIQELLLKNPLKAESDEKLSKDETNMSSDGKSVPKDDQEKSNESSSLITTQTLETQKESEMNSKATVTNKISPTKTKVIRRKARQSELDKLHQDILTGHDYEGIIRACMQPRISSKTKLFDSPVAVAKIAKSRPTSIDQNPPKDEIETKPFHIELIRLNLTTDDMPVIVNEEFINVHLKANNTLLKPTPQVSSGLLDKKLEVNLELKPVAIIPEPKIETASPDVKPESNLIISEERSKVLDLSNHPTKSVLPQKNALSTKKANTNIKKRRNLLLWSKGILKKKTRRLYMSRASEKAWEDIESSDDEINFVTVLKLNTFKDLFCEFASEYANRKISRRKQKRHLKITNEDENENSEKIGNDRNERDSVKPSNDVLISPKKDDGIKLPVQNETSPKSLPNIPKRINLPLDKNFLTLISQSNTTTAAKNLHIADDFKNKNLNITIKLPTVDKKNPTISPTNQTRSIETLSMKPPIDQTARVFTTQGFSNQQKVVIVKPYSNETTEMVKTRSLNSNEQDALITALSANKKTLVSNFVPTTQNRTINMASTSMYKLPVATVEDTTMNSLPMISNVMSINTGASSAKPKLLGDGNISKQLTSSSKSNLTQELNSPIGNHTMVQKSAPANIANPNLSGSKQIPKTTVAGPKMIIEARKSVQKVSIDLPQPSNDLFKNQTEVVDLIDDEDDDDFVDMLRPWIDKLEFKSKKQETEALKMINNTHCLASLFKCMSSTCSYYTNDKDLFKLHLELHRDHQSADSSNFLLCSYCNFRPNSINLLIIHIETAHGYAKFGCRYCFYRSVNEYQVTANHHINFHRNKEKCVLVFEPKKFKNENTEKNHISETIPKVCPALPCPYCRIGFYTTSEYEKHVLGHKEMYPTHCNKCDVQTSKQHILQHLFKCYNKFGNFQCVFCVFGTCNFSSIDTHLSTLHPDKMSYFAERTLNFGKDPTFVEALTIKELSKKITGNVKKILLNYSFDDETFRNADNFGRLSDNLIFRQKVNDPNTFIKIIRKQSSSALGPSPSTSKSVLQINQVMSLHD